MAKTKKVAAVSDLSPGQVNFAVSFKPSRAFNTMRINFGQSLSILPNESPQEAQDRVIVEVMKAVDRHLDKLSKTVVDGVLKAHGNMAPLDRTAR